MSLQERWTEINRKLGVSRELSSKWWEIVKGRYSESQRHYHTLAHLEDMFEKFETVKDKIGNPATVSLAIFFHEMYHSIITKGHVETWPRLIVSAEKQEPRNEVTTYYHVIFEPTRPDNEEKSAELFQQYSQECATEQIRKLENVVVDWVFATKKHQTPEHVTPDAFGQTDLHYFLDMDMSVLGKPEDEYRDYVDKIENEYCHMTQDAFNEGRTKVLRLFLKVPNIFASREFRTLYEKQARENIKNEISRRELLMQCRH